MSTSSAATTTGDTVQRKRTRSKQTGSSRNFVDAKLPLSLPPTFEQSRKQRAKAKLLIGVDEAGRGCHAGPVMVCACHITEEAQKTALLSQGVVNSKDLREAQREEVFERLVNSPGVSFSLAQRSPSEIDERDILETVMSAMSEATLTLIDLLESEETASSSSSSGAPTSSFLVLVDGTFVPEDLTRESVKRSDGSLVVEALVRGDEKAFCVAAASIIAKVTRDRLLRQLAGEHPEYKFDENKGYLTKHHASAIKRHGVVKAHRLTYKPICDLLRNGSIPWPDGRDLIEISPTARRELRKGRRKISRQYCP